MEDEGKSRKQLLRELAQLRRKVAELATSEAECRRAEEALASWRRWSHHSSNQRNTRLGQYLCYDRVATCWLGRQD